MIPSPLPYIRTASIIIIGALIAWGISRFPAVGQLINTLSSFGISKDAIVLALGGVVMALYYYAAKQLGKRWPGLEKWLLNGGTTSGTVEFTKRRRRLGAIIDRPVDPRNIDFGSTFTLPPTPAGFVGTKRKPTGMLGNDTVGDCVIAMMQHAIIVTTGTAKFTAALAIKLYSAITGYVPGNPNTDQGTDPVAAAKYWQKNGIVDAKGIRHELVAYSTIKLGDFDALRAALNLAAVGVAVGVSLNLPESAQDQFPSKKWSVVPGSPIEGGHEVLACNDDGANTGLGTWGSEVAATRQFMAKYVSLILVLITDAAPVSLQKEAIEAIAAIKKVS